MTTYGEIVEPYTRACWEDWDELFEEDSARFEWVRKEAIPNAIDCFIVLEGKSFINYIENKSNTKLQYVDSINKIDVTLYKTNELQYVCVVKDNNLLNSSEIVDLLKPYIIVSKDVVTLQTKPLAEYQSMDVTNEMCIIRTVCTSHQSKTNVNFRKLEQPNIITGVSAGVICLREHLGLCGKALVCYLEYIEEHQIEELQSLLKSLNIVSCVDATSNNILDSNLYI
ncbi:hypothetical protein ACJJTC_013859 [Scirpophaga incertulas]